ncbi:hypothetical protein LTR86_001003 [Recurvomyces mirabilis]|nr:hypothetical protein LTR86_001003 [Recurvomyces mirabilis]
MPTIARALEMNAVMSFWIVNSFLLTSALTQPLIMRLSYAFGGRMLLTLAIGICTLGSLICAVAPGPVALLAGRCLGGCGSGALGVLTQLILHKLATPRNRAKWESTISALYWLGAALGPILGGAAATEASYNFIFWVNVPFGALALVILPFIVSLDDSSSWREVMGVDYLGWLLLWGSIAPILLAISWAMIFVLPLWFEPIVKLDPIISGALLSACTLAMVLFAVVASIIVCYISHIWLILAGWTLVVAGMALLSATTTETVVVIFVPIGLLAGAGFGILYPALTVAVQCDATTDDETIHAVPLQSFFSTIGQCFGIAVGSCVFLNQLESSLRRSDLTLDHAEEYARDAVSLANAIAQMPNSRNELQATLAASYGYGMRWVWISLCIIAGIALLLSLVFVKQGRRISQRRRSRRSLPEAFELAA